MTERYDALIEQISQLRDLLKKKVAYHNEQVKDLHDMAHRARREGVKEGLSLYAWWKDGVQYVGTCGQTLKKAIEEFERK